jgi:hypothetical protein
MATAGEIICFSDTLLAVEDAYLKYYMETTYR